MKEQVTAIFDIGKTNKKFFLFNRDFKEVYREYTSFEVISDEDGHPTEDLSALHQWLKEVFDRMLRSKEYDIRAINFSSYGASFVHLDYQGNVLTPLYNYTKSYEASLLEEFYTTYGPETTFSERTGTTNAGMLNSGMQLYWLKKRKPEVFKKIHYSLHLPQYLSYVFTGIPLSEYTSIGCHTGLWDYQQQDYHIWVYREGIDKMLAPVVPTETSMNMNYLGKRMSIGVGIHDSSAALIPYIRSLKKPFILLSTGTWSVVLNPFTDGSLSAGDMQEDCINYMRVNGSPVRAARLFLGNEYNLQVEELAKKYGVSDDAHLRVSFDPALYGRLLGSKNRMFSWKCLSVSSSAEVAPLTHPTFEAAYHQLVMELVELQARSINLAKGSSAIKRLYVDGGFTANKVFIEALALAIKPIKIRTTEASLGSALGAALAVSNVRLNSRFLREKYALKKHVPSILKA